ncbi:MAG TPA: hypothetical protein VLA49_20465 [Anaerolineales bacterium]|nr:hypothetical protein [Anaerolineales bacterium]
MVQERTQQAIQDVVDEVPKAKCDCVIPMGSNVHCACLFIVSTIASFTSIAIQPNLPM